jgi:hypothetical protein
LGYSPRRKPGQHELLRSGKRSSIGRSLCFASPKIQRHQINREPREQQKNNQ